MNSDKMENPKKPKPNVKSAVNNQWTSTNMRYYPDKRERRDGPGGENADKK